jgi:hypothetical protein
MNFKKLVKNKYLLCTAILLLCGLNFSQGFESQGESLPEHDLERIFAELEDMALVESSSSFDFGSSSSTASDSANAAGTSNSSSETYSPSSPGGIVAMLVGILLIGMSFPLLWDNEQTAVRIAQLLGRAQKESIEVDAKKPLEENNMKLVYVSGDTENKKPVEDKELGVEFNKCVKVKRTVEMFQWVEHRQHQNHNNQNNNNHGHHGHNQH